MPRHRRVREAERAELALPPMLDRLIYAERYRGEANRAGALAAFGRLALATIPTSGVLAPADDEQLFKAIEDITRDQLGSMALRDAIKRALATITQFRDREAIEAAFNEFQSTLDQAYFYAGLAFGVTLAGFGDSSWR